MIVCDPAVSVTLPLVAAPFTSATAVPRSLPSTSNWTVPVGVGAPETEGVTVAVNVSGWPAMVNGLLAVTTIDAVGTAAVTVSDPGAPAYVASPE